jgi:hypothetical protein
MYNNKNNYCKDIFGAIVFQKYVVFCQRLYISKSDRIRSGIKNSKLSNIRLKRIFQNNLIEKVDLINCP